MRRVLGAVGHAADDALRRLAVLLESLLEAGVSDQVRLTGRSTMGVTLLRLDGEERVTSVFAVLEDEVADEAEDAPPDAPPPEPGEGDDTDG